MLQIFPIERVGALFKIEKKITALWNIDCTEVLKGRAALKLIFHDNLRPVSFHVRFINHAT